jgi:ATP-dependent DNA helicase RecQ
MHDSTLIALAQAKPQTEDELIGIAGMGEKRREKYGQVIVAIISGF